VRVHLFGRPRIETARQEALAPVKPIVPLLYLAFDGGWVDRGCLRTLLWPEAPEAQARHALRVLLHRAKALPWAASLEVAPERVRWSVPTDVAAFRRAIRDGDGRAALAWHHAPLLSEGSFADHPAFDAWVATERQALLDQARQAVLDLAAAAATAGDHGGAATLLHGFLEQDPWAEDVLGRYLEQAYLAGRRDDALRRAERFERDLRAEVGLEPLEATRTLVATLRRSAPLVLAEVAATPPPTIPLEVLRPPRLVGRDPEYAMLTAGRASLTLVSGEAGVGKTRLALDALPHARWLHGAESASHIPLYPIQTYVRRHLDDLPDLGPYRADLARLVPEVAPADAPAPIEPALAHGRLFEALARLLEGSAGPIVVDDVQWVDPTTLDLLVHVAERGRARIVVLKRPSAADATWQRVVDGLLRHVHVVELRLHRLAEPDVRALVRDLAGHEVDASAIAAYLHARTGGNPLLLLETLKALFVAGALDARAGRWQPQLESALKGSALARIPAGVASVMAHRGAALSENARLLLGVLSVAGSEIGSERLGAIAEVGRWAVVQGLEELEEHGLLEDGRPSHDLVRETAYARLSPARRRHLHARVAETAPPDEDAQVVAEHWIQARRPERASDALGRAASSLRGRGLIEEALTVVRRSSQLLDAPSSRVLEAELLVSLRRYEEAEALLGALRTAVDDRVRARALVAATHLELRRGRRSEAAATAGLAMEASRRLDPHLQLEGILAAANVAALTGEQEALLVTLEAHLEHHGGAVPGGLRAQALSNLAWLHAGLGRFEEALRHYESAWQVAAAGGDRYWQVWIAANTLYCCLELGCPDAALAHAEGCLQDADTSDASEILRINLAKAYVDLGRDAEAIGLLEGLLRDCRDPSNRAVALGYLSDLRHRAGDAAAGRAALEEAVAHLDRTDLDRARVRIAIAALRYGDDAQRRRVAPFVASLSRGAVPGYVWRELEALL